MGTNPATGQPNTPFQFYSTNPNAFVAPLDPTQQAGIAGTNYYANAAQPYYQGATDLTLAGAGPANLGALQTNRYMSPFLSDVYGTQLAGEQMLNQQQASGLQGQAIQAGAFGGDRSGVAAANLAYQQNLANNQTNAGLLQAGYTQAQNTAAQQQAAQLAAQQANLARLTSAGAQLGGLGTAAQTAGLQGAQAQQAAGLTQQQTAQAGLQALYNQFLQAQAYPFQTLGELANISEGIGALSGSTTTSTQPSSFFSDERLKEDIQPIGETYDGQKIVKFKYKGKPGKQIGLIAQDVEKHHPDAVGLMGGYKTVDYDRATDEAAHRGHFYSGGLVPSSEGGAVGIEHAGEGFADGGMPGVAAQQLNLYSNLGLIPGKGNPYMPSTGSGGLGGMGGGQPRQLMVAHEPTQHQPTMMDAAQSMSNWANLGEKGDAALFGKTGDGGLVGGIKSLSQGFQNINAGGTFGGNSQEDVVNNLRSKYGDPSQPPPVASDASPSTNYRGGRIHEAHGGLVPRHPYAAGGISTPYENTGDDSKGYMGEAQDAQPAPPKQLQTASTPSQGPSGAQQLGSLAGGIGGLASGVGMAASGLSKLLPLLAARNGGFIHEPYHDDAPHHHGGGEGLMGFGALAARRRAAGGLVGRKGYQGDGAVTDDTQDGSQDTSQDVNPNGPSLYDRIIGRPTRQEIMERWAASQGATNPLTTGFDMGLNQNQLAGLIAHHPDDPNSVQAMKNSRQAEVAWLATRPWGNTAEPDRSGLGVLSDPYGTNVPETIVNSGPVSTPVAGRTGSYPLGDYPFNEPSVAGGLVPAGSYPPGDRPFNEPPVASGLPAGSYPPGDRPFNEPRLNISPAGAATPPGGLLPTSSVAPSNNAAPTPVGGEGQTPAATRQTPEGPGAFDKGGWMERNQSWLVPLLSGIGGMASSNSRYLGSALLQGLGAGAQAYEGVQNQMQAREKQAAETTEAMTRGNLTQAQANAYPTTAALTQAAAAQGLAKNAIFEAGGRQWVLKADGTPVLLGEWLQHPSPTLSGDAAMATARRYGLNPSGIIDDPEWAAIRQQESGGHQFRSDGMPLVSGAGAVGIGQVMPGTGPEAAQLAGLPWDETRFKYDSAYNEALGKAYYAKQRATFGDPDMAAAAYNAGPQAVQSALAKSQIDGRPWLSHLPAETQNYVPSVRTLRQQQQQAATPAPLGANTGLNAPEAPRDAAPGIPSKATTPGEYSYTVPIGPVGSTIARDEANYAAIHGDVNRENINKNLEEINNRAAISQDGRQKMLELLANMVRPSGPLATGAGIEDRANVMNLVDTWARSSGLDKYMPNGWGNSGALTQQQVAEKLILAQSALEARGMGERALGAIPLLLSANANNSMTPEAIKQILADSLIGSQRDIERAAYARKYVSTTPLGIGLNINQAFDADHNISSYYRDRSALMSMMTPTDRLMTEDKQPHSPVQFILGSPGTEKSPNAQKAFRNPADIERFYKNPGLYRYFSPQVM